MNFAKLFGLGAEDADDPPEHPPVHRPAVSRPAPPKARPTGDPKAAVGFDPYNSGVFKKNNAWERINRR